MNLDFILFNAPKRKYSFMDFWGETIFIPCYQPTSQHHQRNHSLLSSLTKLSNCYRASKSTEVYFSVDNAISELNGDIAKLEPEAGTSTTDSGYEE
jgi:hypothetical protein